jgi:hypothetical protein
VKFVIINLLMVLCACAQTNKITGSIAINYSSRDSSPPKVGAVDTYAIDIQVANSAKYSGTVVDTPQIVEGMFAKKIVQPRSLQFDVACDVVNPANPSQTRNIGKLFGRVPITSEGVYDYDRGSLAFEILPMGKAGGFTSKFTGPVRGKPLLRPANWMDTLKREAVNITRMSGGKVTTIVLTKYDRMEFANHVIGKGPIAIYDQAMVSGEMLYDYNKNCWFLNNMTAQYADGNTMKIDRMSGTIRWVENPKRKQNGEGEYQFDIRVNEPLPGAGAAFDNSASDESAFFQVDTSIPSLTGTMKYKDIMNGDMVTTSRVSVDITGNGITKQQLMILGKLIIFSTIVPMNGE